MCCANMKSQEEIASSYALQVALQTMKERCQQLQARLSMVEEENLQLKIDKQRYMRQSKSSDSLGEIDKLQEQITQLSRQKSQLTHHIYMVATENKQLWTKLSLLTEANESLGTRLSKISAALSNHNSRTDFCLSEDQKPYESSQTLEEISLNLMNNIRQETAELEQQYADSIKDCDFTLTSQDGADMKSSVDVDEEEEMAIAESLTAELNQCKQQFKKLLAVVKTQRKFMRESVYLLKLYAKGTERCMVCKKYVDACRKTYRDAEAMVGDSLTDRLECRCQIPTDHRVCPMCRRIYYKKDNEQRFMDDFLEHVNSHFPSSVNGEDDFDKLYYEQPPSVA